MRTVLSNHQEVCHVWASQTQSEGRASNMFFEGETIYSYGRHFKIAKFQIMPNGEKVVLFNADSYSISTSKHQTYTQRAIPNNYKVFTIPAALWACFDSVMAWYQDQIDDTFGLSKRAREYANMHYQSAIRIIAKMENYSYLHNKPLQYELSEDQQTIIARAKVQEQQSAERAEARAAAAEAKRLVEIEELKIACNGNVEEFWHKHGHLPAGYHNIHNYPDTLCRIVGTEVITSKGARVPVEHAKRVLPIILRCRRNNKGWKANGDTIRIGHYTFREITANGDITIGCHNIAWSEVEYIAKQLELI